MTFYSSAIVTIALSCTVCELFDSLREIYKAVVLAKLMYASPAWWGFTAASDRQQIDAFVRRGVRFGLYNAGDPTPSQLAKDADDTLHQNIG